MKEKQGPPYVPASAIPVLRSKLAAAILRERRNGAAKFGPQHDLDGGRWLAVVTEELGEAAQAFNELVWSENHEMSSAVPGHAQDLAAELVQTAATCIGWIEAIAMQYGVTIPIVASAIWPAKEDE